MTKLVKQTTLAYISLILACTFIGLKHLPKVMASEFVAGQHYTVLEQKATSAPEVKMFYTPYCRPCALVHTPLRTMAERAEIKFIEVPVAFGPMAGDIQEVLAVADKQGISKPFVSELLTSIHLKPSTAPTCRHELADMLDRCGGDATGFRTGCEDVRDQIKNFDELAERYRIGATPTIIVNGNKQINLAALKNFNELEQLLIQLSRA